MAKILLATLNARYIHAAFGLRYLLANLGELRADGEILEFEISDRTLDICEELLARNPVIIGFGVYIWNVVETERVIKVLRN
jgi:proteasome assembly chaperone (PAC2) family protein